MGLLERLTGKGGNPVGQGREVRAGLGSSVVKTADQMQDDRMASAAHAYALEPFAGDELKARIGQQFKNPLEAESVFNKAIAERETKARAAAQG